MTLKRQVFSDIGDWSRMRSKHRWNVPQHYNIAQQCCDSWATAAPDKVAIIHVAGDGVRRTLTYSQLKRASDGLAASLRSRGVMRGDRVAVLLAQCPEVIITHMAGL